MFACYDCPWNDIMAKLSATFLSALTTILLGVGLNAAEPTVDFNRDVRPILSNRCFRCHGPDAKQRKSDLRLDHREVAVDDLGVIVPGDPANSELLARLTAPGKDKMPPSSSGLKLTEAEIKTLTQWVQQGAPYAGHWAYQRPQRPKPPALSGTTWGHNEIDQFVLARLQGEKLAPAKSADRYTLARRLSLDLTGLPPTIDQVDRFLADKSPQAYEHLVDELLKSPRYGERWAAMWLDLARYADSAGYADDPPRTIWLYRDWVIRALNQNKPFNQFTIEQIAGDLLPEPTPAQLTATAFHRNTLTNSEGGTDDEEFRNVAIVDRVNTTLQVWMGTTIRCAQCHDHKYDPISQEEYFQFFAYFNNSQDADRRDESPLLTRVTEEMEQRKATLLEEIVETRTKLIPSDAQLQAQQTSWKQVSQRNYSWQPLQPTIATASNGTTLTVRPNASVLASGKSPATETYVLEIETDLQEIRGLQLEALPDPSLPHQGPGRSSGGNFALSHLRVLDQSDSRPRQNGRFIRIDLAGEKKMIHVAEIQVFRDGKNIARTGKATQSSTGFGGPAARAIDGNTDGDYQKNSVTHTAISKNPWLEIDLGKTTEIDKIVIWNRTDSGLQSRLDGFSLSILNDERQTTWKQVYPKAPPKEVAADLTGARSLPIVAASADYEQAGVAGKDPQQGWTALAALTNDDKPAGAGWAVGGNISQSARAVFQFKQPVGAAGKTTRLKISLEQAFGSQHSLGHFRISATTSSSPIELTPRALQPLLAQPVAQLTPEQKKALVTYYNRAVPPPKAVLDRIAAIQKQIDSIKGVTVPIMRELPVGKGRKTHIQIRGNFLAKDKEVTLGVPSAFHPFPADGPSNRLGVANWLVSPENPLTARVVVNRYWEQLFGLGLVSTSEEFGTQGSLPSHPALLDWLAVDLMENGWDVKDLLKTIVMSATYRQSSQVIGDAAARDPNNQLLSRGPRFRLSAEMIRDQALAVSGLLSSKMYGPSVQPPRPNLGLKAAFGGSTDWTTSPGEDRHRRGLYTSWRRSIPYPSMAAFDAPSRNVCTISRTRTNTPLQALVTLNDPVYVEAAQHLARLIQKESSHGLAAQLTYAFRNVLSRPPAPAEAMRLTTLYEQLQQRYRADPALATQMATSFAGAVPETTNIVDLAVWTVVSNVLMNLDEALTKR
jgi:hypothetical protein